RIELACSGIAVSSVTRILTGTYLPKFAAPLRRNGKILTHSRKEFLMSDVFTLARRLAPIALLLAILALFGVRPALAGGVVTICDESHFDAALVGGGLVTFSCGPSPHTINLSAIKLITIDTTINGGNLITLKAHNTNHF